MTPAIYREPLCPLKVLPLAARPLWTASEGITPPSSLLPAHAPDQNPSDASVLPFYTRSLQVATSPCWKLALPDVISVDPSVDAWLPTPVEPSWCIYPFLPTKHRPSPRYDKVGFHNIRTAASVRYSFRGCKHSLMFRPPPLLATLTAPTVAFTMRSSGDFYFRTYHGLLPPRVPDILAVRTG